MATRRAKKVQLVAGEKRRLNLKMDSDLAEWAFDYARRHNTSLTQVISDYFRGLRKRESVKLSRDAEQI